MKNRTVLIFAVLMLSICHAQVGIGTTNPTATLHIANVDSLAYGLRIEKTPYQASHKVLNVDDDGNVGYAELATGELPTFQNFLAKSKEVRYFRPADSQKMYYH